MAALELAVSASSVVLPAAGGRAGPPQLLSPTWVPPTCSPPALRHMIPASRICGAHMALTPARGPSNPHASLPSLVAPPPPAIDVSKLGMGNALRHSTKCPQVPIFHEHDERLCVHRRHQLLDAKFSSTRCRGVVWHSV
ncbi:hypothetical protein VPH35_018152 [Triticum aestivum]